MCVYMSQYMLHEFGKRYYEKAPNALLAAIDERFQAREGEGEREREREIRPSPPLPPSSTPLNERFQARPQRSPPHPL